MSQESIAKISLDKVALTLPSYREEGGAVPEVEQKAHFKSKQPDPRQLIEFPLLVRVMMLLLLIVFIIIGATYFWAINADQVPVWVAPAMTGLWVFAGMSVITLFYWMWRQFSRFSSDLSIWANQLLQGDFSSRMPLRTFQCPSRGIREHINAIATDYESLAHLQQLRLSQQARHIEQKKHYLSVLYDVAAAINKSHSLEDLLQRFLHTLTTVVKAKAATVRLLDKDDQMRLVASIGLSDDIIKLEDTLPAPTCLCGKALTDAKIMVNSDSKQCGLIAGKEFFAEEDDIDMLAIPLEYRGKTLGVYNLFVQREENVFLEDEHELLESIGQHLGMAIEKSGVESDARTLSIIEERTRMAHELHDSLAQTLASLRYKVRLFDDSLNQGKEELIWSELEGLENTIDDAYAELRSLITHFRAPIDGKGVVRSVQRISDRFRQETELDVFYYHNWDLEELSRDAEIEVVRIVQEALANIRKHSQASNVRILLSSTAEGHCSVLVEDDGIGLPKKRKKMNKETGEHIGLSVMQERADRLNGELQIDSDEGEGTLVQLNFDAPMHSRNKSNTESVVTNLADVTQTH
ncbi:MAG TPA: GAF domain-containing protein [Leucothrix mucor]|nr:GAF domain-containing protein [Leucothrix mucor]